ncbi:hypothetical protein [Embleya sp. NPDC001921]
MRQRHIGTVGVTQGAYRSTPENEALAAAEPDDPAAGDGGAPAETDPDGAQVVSERAGRLVLKTLAGAGGSDALSSAREAVSAHHGNNYLPLLEGHYRSGRAALFTLLDAVGLGATSADRAVLGVVEFIRANRRGPASSSTSGSPSSGTGGRSC